MSVVVLDHRSQAASLVQGIDGIVCPLHAVEFVGDVVVDGQLQRRKTEAKVKTRDRQTQSSRHRRTVKLRDKRNTHDFKTDNNFKFRD